MDAIHELHEQVHHMRGEIVIHSLNHGHINSRRPLPGSIYPMLKKMVKEELIIKQEDGRYKLTENGQKTIYNIIGTSPTDRYNGDNAIKNAIKEIDNYSSFLEDVKTEKLQAYQKQINVLSDRLQKLKKSLTKRI
jgi:DNA-binding PadR family transcriptional regulator